MVVYSLSELLLTWGINRTLHFVQAMKTITSEQGHPGVAASSGASPSPSPASCASPGSGAVSVSVIALVHTTLHPPHILSRLLPQHHHSVSSSTTSSTSSGSPLSSGFNCAIFVRANDGNPISPHQLFITPLPFFSPFISNITPYCYIPLTPPATPFCHPYLSGTLSEELACEVQGIRVSSVTGKVTEERDYFRRIIPTNVVTGTITGSGLGTGLGSGLGSGVLAQGPSMSLLTPVVKLSKNTTTKVKHDTSTQSTTSTSTSTSTSSSGSSAATGNSGSNHGMDNNTIRSTATTSATFNTQHQHTHPPSSLPTDTSSVSSTNIHHQHHQRWITFDSTDPEFDDDSDPDADLDL